MKRQTHPLEAKEAPPMPAENPAVTIAIWIIGGVILFESSFLLSSWAVLGDE